MTEVVEGHIEGVPQRVGPFIDGGQYHLPLELVSEQGLFAMQNVEIGPNGEVFKRWGSVKHISGAYTGTPSGTGIGLIRFSSSSEAIFYVAANKFLEDVSGTLTDRTGGLTIDSGVDNFVVWVDAFGTGYFTDGVNAPWKWTAAGGTNIVTAGLSSRFTSCKGVTWHDNRLWWWNTNNSEGEIWFTDQDNLETIGVNSNFDIKGVITAVNAVNKVLFIHTYEQVWRIEKTGNTAVPYSSLPSIKFGAGSRRNLVTLPGGMQMVGRVEGFYLWDGASSPRRISQALDGSRYWDDVRSGFDQELDIHGMVVNPIKGHVWCFLAHGSGQTTLNHVQVYDYLRNRWFGPHIISASSWARITEILYTTGYSDGLIFKQDQDVRADNGVAIKAVLETSGAAPAGDIIQTEWSFARLYFKNQSTSADINWTQSGPDVGSNQGSLSIASTYVGIGTFIIGSSAIAGEGVLSTRDIDLQGFGAHLKLRIENEEVDEEFELRFIDRVYETHGIVRDATV
jgi:hypothetical protein